MSEKFSLNLEYFFIMVKNLYRQLKFVFNHVPLVYVPLFLTLRFVAIFLLKYNGRILQFSLSNKYDHFNGYPLSETCYKLLSETCLVIQGPTSKLSPKTIVEYISRSKLEHKIQMVIYCGPDTKLMAPYADVCIKPPKLKNSDYNQFNLQRASTLSGLNEAKNLGFKYALKLRADSMLTRRDAILQLHMHLIGSEKKVVSSVPQKAFYEPFVGDHLQYGRVGDLIKLWSEHWCGEFDISLTDDIMQEGAKVAKSPEWVLGRNLVKSFGKGALAVVEPELIGYCFLKYDFYDPKRFDWESAPHFGQNLITPGKESYVGSRESK